MAPTPSNMLPLGTAAPDFALANIDGRIVRLADFAGSSVLVVAFICNHCPFVKHLRTPLADFGRWAQAQGAAVVAINSNDVARYPDDSPARMAEEAAAAGYTFAYLFDDTQAVAKAYRAACTPDFYVFDAARRLAYRGQFDSSRPGNGIAPTGEDLRAAVTALLAGRTPHAAQRPSIGCNIKWKPGNEPG